MTENPAHSAESVEPRHVFEIRELAKRARRSANFYGYIQGPSAALDSLATDLERLAATLTSPGEYCEQAEWPVVPCQQSCVEKWEHHHHGESGVRWTSPGATCLTPPAVHPADRICVDCEHSIGAHRGGKSCAECGCVTPPGKGGAGND